MTSLALYADTPFEDEAAYAEFLGANEIAHQTISAALQRLGKLVPRVPLAESPLDSSAWLLDHWLLHLAEGAALGLSVPDLSDVDMSDSLQFQTWMRAHSALHSAENLSLGIFT